MEYSVSSEDYSTSVRDSPSRWPGKDNKGYAYKKSSYQYSSSGNNSLTYGDKTADKNIDQLDALLEDLKHERQTTREKDLLSTSVNYKTLDRERADPVNTITKTTRVVKTTKQQSDALPNFDNIENFSNSEYNIIKSNTLKDVSKSSPTNANTFESKRVYESNRTIENAEVYPSSTVSTHLEKDLENIALTGNILPVPGTKVTTTVRTYTYEIPAGTSTNVVNNQLLQNVNYNTIQRNEIRDLNTYQRPSSNVPASVVYNTESYSTINKTNERPVVSNQIYEIKEHREVNTTNSGIGPLSHKPPMGPEGTSSKTIVYNVNTTENTHLLPDPNYYPRSPSQSPNAGGPYEPPHGNLPPGSTTNRYYYKESTNSVNTVHEPTLPPHVPSHKLPPSGYPHGDDSPSRNPPGSTVSYKYTSSTTNTRHGQEYGTPQTNGQLAPFPVDGVEFPVSNGSPPQRIDDLMQSFGPTDGVDHSDLSSTLRKREIDTSVASPNQPIIPSVNKAGKEVYYPPGHEMMLTKREEMSSGSAAGGRWAKGSGMYEYESGYKSKSKTKSGGAVVPVCLPLCCAMPCSIM